MAIFSYSNLLRQLSVTGWVGIGLILTAPAFANPNALPSAEQQSGDRLASPSLSQLLPPVLQQAGLLVAEARQDVIDTAAAKGSFNTLLQLLNQLGMTEDLRGFGRFTVFAPTDAAFAAVPPDVMKKLSDDRALMSRVLAYHVISSGRPLTSDQISSPVSVKTLERSEVRITRRNGRLSVNDVRVINADIQATNGVIHAIDQVLIPPDVAAELKR